MNQNQLKIIEGKAEVLFPHYFHSPIRNGDVNYNRDVFVSGAQAMDKLAEAEIERLKGLLNHSIAIIKEWNGHETWDIYYNQAPEMKMIKQYLKEQNSL